MALTAAVPAQKSTVVATCAVIGVTGASSLSTPAVTLPAVSLPATPAVPPATMVEQAMAPIRPSEHRPRRALRSRARLALIPASAAPCDGLSADQHEYADPNDACVENGAGRLADW